MMEASKDLKNMTFGELKELISEFGEKGYLAKYIFGFIHDKDVCEVDELSTLSKKFREALAESGYFISQIKLVEKLEDPDGTIKYVFELGDGLRVESVLLFDGKRRTVCISSQVGCWMGCSFCATAKLGFGRDLTAAEIVDQVNFICKDECKVSNVVYMGMGEPFNNYDTVMRSVEILNSSLGKNIGIRHITLSTCGVVDGIERLADEELKPRLAVSLNGSTDRVRSSIMPVNKKCKLRELFRGLRHYQGNTGNRVTFEYVMIKGINDSDEDLRHLVNLVGSIRCNVNLIEFNGYDGCDYSASSRKRINMFADRLHKKGIECTIRLKLGESIKGACGQLGAGQIKRES